MIDIAVSVLILVYLTQIDKAEMASITLSLFKLFATGMLLKVLERF